MSVNTDLKDPDGSALWCWWNNYHKSSEEHTRESAKYSIRRFERFLAVKGGYQFEGEWTEINLRNVSPEQMLAPRNVDQHDVYEFLSEYLVPEYSADTQHSTVSTLGQAYRWCQQRTKVVEADPISYVLESHDLLEQQEGRNPHIIDIEEARSIITSWENPRWLAINLMLPKTTRRIGAIVNLDLRDVNLDHPGCKWTVHSDIRHKPDYLRFSADKSKGEGNEDKKREDGNKTETTRIIPIDDELKDALIWYLTIRRQNFEPRSPLFYGDEGKRIHGSTVGKVIRQKSKEMGYYYDPNDDDNINCHYWRHWATTWFEDTLGENSSITDYLRGDKGSETKALYNHWSGKKERLYLNNVPKFFTDHTDYDGQ